MSDDLVFDQTFASEPDVCARLTPAVRRMIANNPNPFTFTGTCTYIIGNGQVCVLDPGPEDSRHMAALLNELRHETVTHILISHTHRDHSPAAKILQEATGASIIGCRAYRVPDLPLEMNNAFEASVDQDYAPDTVLREGDIVEGPDWRLVTMETPGHMADHLAFALPQEEALFSADHVMAWSTTVIAPPDGSMRDYMASLEKLKDRSDAIYWPGHGGPVRQPQRFIRGLIAHRRQREAAILNRLKAGDRTIAAIVEAIYPGLNPALQGAAGLSVLAHLQDLKEREKVATDGLPLLGGEYWPAAGN